MSQARAISNLKKAAKRRQAAETERHAAAADLRQRIKEARAAGISPTQIAQEARVSRQAVYEALGQRPS
jgi:hypothetical protein